MDKLVIPLSQGQDEGVSAKIAPNGVFAHVENRVITKDGEVRKRHGFQRFGGSQVLAAGDDPRLMSHEGRRLLWYDEALYCIDPELSSLWVSVPRFPYKGAFPSRREIGRDDVSADTSTLPVSSDIAWLNNYRFVSYMDNTGNDRPVITAINSAGTLVFRKEIPEAAAWVRLIEVGDNVVAVYATASAVKIVLFDTTDPPTSSAYTNWYNASASPVTLTGPGGETLLRTDVASFDSTTFLLAECDGTDIDIYRFNLSGTAVDSDTLTSTGDSAPGIAGASGGSIFVFYHVLSGDVVGARYLASDLASGPTSSGTVFTLTATNIPLGRPLVSMFGTTTAWVACNGYQFTTLPTVYGASFTSAVSGTLDILLDGEWALTKPCVYNSEGLILTGTTAPLDRVATLVRSAGDSFVFSTPTVESVAARGEIVDFLDQEYDSPRLLVQDDQLYTAIQVVARGDLDAATPSIGVDLLGLDFAELQRLQNVELQGLTLASGAWPHMFDGHQWYESADLAAPAIYKTTVSASGGAVVAGTYTYYAVSERFVNGRLQRSRPSAPEVVVVSSGSTNRVLINAILPKTMREGPFDTSRAFARRVQIYRTTDNGEIAYRVTPEEGQQSILSDLVGYDDTLVDADITANPVLYTQTGLLYHSPPPACKYLALGSNRLLAGGLENPKQLQWSKLLVAGEPPNWFFDLNDNQFTQEIPEDVTGVGHIDGRYIAFSATAVYESTGDGPDEFGGGGEFTPLRRLPSSVGCKDGRSIVEVPQGLLFQGTDRQLWLLPRGGGTPQSVSGPVRDSLDRFPVCTAAKLNTTRQLVAFAVQNTGGTQGGLLVADVEDPALKTWYCWSLASTESAPDETNWGGTPVNSIAVWDGEFAVVSDGTGAGSQVLLQTDGVFSDNTATSAVERFISDPIILGDYHPFGIGGWGRLFDLLITMSASSSVGITLKFIPDAGSSDSRAFTLSTYDQFKMVPNARKLSKFRLVLTSTDVGDNDNVGPVLHTLTLRTEAVTGTRRLPSSKVA